MNIGQEMTYKIFGSNKEECQYCINSKPYFDDEEGCYYYCTLSTKKQKECFNNNRYYDEG